ncbi:MAG: hypothetical protein WC437_04915 [Patescibacteria group bacterium]|jgi:hypothetical protein
MKQPRPLTMSREIDEWLDLDAEEEENEFVQECPDVDNCSKCTRFQLDLCPGDW